MALRSLKRNAVLTLLMVAAIGVGIGASMTMVTVFRAMDGDPIPRKSGQLFAPQLDNWGPAKQKNANSADHLQSQLSNTDAQALMNAHAARRQAAMYAGSMALTPSDANLRPFQVNVRATNTDFFPMFEVPLRFGSAWSAADDAARAEVVVISRELNDKLFRGANSVGNTVNLDDREYRVVGVIDAWQPTPRFYDALSSNKFGKSEDLYLPFTRAVASAVTVQGNLSCSDVPDPGWDGLLRSECVWLQLWVELPDAAAVARYRAFLDNYAAEQRRSGRFTWAPHTQLRDVRQWLKYQHVVLDEVRILVLVSFSFLAVCLLNAMGLMLAKIMGRSAEIGVRRALGANRRAIFLQCLMETGVIGFAGGLCGMLLTVMGLLGLRAVLSESLVELTRIDAADIAIAIVLAVGATMIAGLYPTWRAAQVQPAWQLKSQ